MRSFTTIPRLIRISPGSARPVFALVPMQSTTSWARTVLPSVMEQIRLLPSWETDPMVQPKARLTPVRSTRRSISSATSPQAAKGKIPGARSARVTVMPRLLRSSATLMPAMDAPTTIACRIGRVLRASRSRSASAMVLIEKASPGFSPGIGGAQALAPVAMRMRSNSMRLPSSSRISRSLPWTRVTRQSL